jgi:hypothetical protein
MKTPVKHNKNKEIWFEMQYSDDPKLYYRVNKSMRFPGKYVFSYRVATHFYVNSINEVNQVLKEDGFEPLTESDFS